MAERLGPTAFIAAPFLPSPDLASPTAWAVVGYPGRPGRHRAHLVVRGCGKP